MLVTLLAGCGVFPSDPSVPPLALRVDGGVISVLIPHCGDEKVVAAAVGDITHTPGTDRVLAPGDRVELHVVPSQSRHERATAVQEARRTFRHDLPDAGR